MLPEHLADLWLEAVANGTMHNYADQILHIHKLSPHATKQLITDIGMIFEQKVCIKLLIPVFLWLYVSRLAVIVTKQLFFFITIFSDVLFAHFSDYMCNVLDDLGLQPSESLKQIIDLLKANEAEYSDISDNMPQRFASAIANMRSLTLD